LAYRTSSHRVSAAAVIAKQRIPLDAEAISLQTEVNIMHNTGIITAPCMFTNPQLRVEAGKLARDRKRPRLIFLQGVSIAV